MERWYNFVIVAISLLCLVQLGTADNDISIQVAEMTNVGSVLTNIPQELKWPSTDKRTYTILSGQEYTQVGQHSGILKVKKQMDREELCPDNREHCYIDVTVAVLLSNVRTPGSPPKLVKIQIEVTDINDNVPKFEHEIIQKRMSEAVDVHTSIRLDSAVDPDYGTNSIQGYKLISTSGVRSKDKFFELETIDNVDGSKIPKLKLKKALDRERRGVHELLLEAYDGGTPALTGTATVRINITDSNDNVPKFDEEAYKVEVWEHEEERTEIIQVVAKDKDVGPNGKIVYKFPSTVSAEEREIFALDPGTGVISVKNSEKLDFETRKIHHLTVEATDMGPNPVSTYVVVTVTVKDVNDNKPQVEVSFMQSESVKEAPLGSPFDAVIMENIDVGQYIAFVTITDKDGGAVSCDIPRDGIFSLKSIEENTGRFFLKIDQKLDREKKTSYDLQIDASDRGTPRQTNTRILKLKVGDINDNAPRFFRKEFEAKVSETASKGTVVSELQAKDTDESPGPNSNVTYSLLNQTDFVMKKGVKYPLTQVFKIDPVSGEVRLAIGNVLDAENAETGTQPGYLTVLARDDGEPSLNTTTKLKITVIDENDNPPVFTKESYLFQVEEHSSDGKYVGLVVATDDDVSDANGEVTYTIERFQSDDRITSPEDESLWLEMFQVDAKKGFIHFYGNQTKLDREAYNGRPITISVVASDDGSPRRRAEATVKILLSDINDNKPLVFSPDGRRDIAFVQIVRKNSEVAGESSDNTDSFAVSPWGLQSAPTRTWASVVIYRESNVSGAEGFLPQTITQVQATDMDEGQNALLSYVISAGDDNKYFEVDHKDGNLTFAEDVNLDEIRLGCHVLKIMVSDLGTPKLHSDASVNIFLSRIAPGDVNITDAMRECQSNPLFPHAVDDSLSIAGLDSFTIYIIIGFGVLIFIIILVIVIVLVKCHCCDKHKKSRSYNCQQGKAWNNSLDYSEDGKKNSIRKRGSNRRSYNGQGTVDSRSSFHSEWTASQTHIALEKAEKVRVLPDLPSVGSQESRGVQDSGTGDSVSGDAYHPATYADVPNHQSYLPNYEGQYNIQPHNSMSPMQYGGLMIDLPPHQMGYIDHPNMHARAMISPKCTSECLIYGHGDHCWMPDSLLRAQAQGPIDMMSGGNPDRVVYQNHPVEAHALRYHGDPNTPYYYDPGQKFSQLSSNEGSEHLSYSKGHGDGGFHHPGAGDGMQPHPGYQHPVMHAPSPHPHQMRYQNESDRERAYINLQGYDPAQNQPEEMHSNLSSASSNNNPYGTALPQNTQRYRPDPNHPQMFYPNTGNPRYDMPPNTQPYIPGMHDSGPVQYNEDYSASNLLPPISSGPGDYGHHWDHNRSIPTEQQALLSRQEFSNRSGRTSNPDPAEQERLLNQNPDGAQTTGTPSDGSGQNKTKEEKLSTISEHHPDPGPRNGWATLVQREEDILI